jgi:hypothetical protein
MGSYTHTLVLTIYGRKLIAESDAVFVFASEKREGRRLIARGLSARCCHVRTEPRDFSARRSRALGRQAP